MTFSRDDIAYAIAVWRSWMEFRDDGSSTFAVIYKDQQGFLDLQRWYLYGAVSTNRYLITGQDCCDYVRALTENETFLQVLLHEHDHVHAH